MHLAGHLLFVSFAVRSVLVLLYKMLKFTIYQFSFKITQVFSVKHLSLDAYQPSILLTNIIDHTNELAHVYWSLLVKML